MPTSATIHVNGCFGLALAGASVTIKHLGTTVASGTTNGAGNYSVSLAPGNYTADISAGARFLGLIGHAFTVPGATVTLTMGPGAGYDCFGMGVPCPIPVPDTLNFTDGFLGVSGTLVFGAGPGPGLWGSSCLSFTDTAGCFGRGRYSGCDILNTVCPILYSADPDFYRTSVGIHNHLGFNCPDVVVGCGSLTGSFAYFTIRVGTPVYTCPTIGGGALFFSFEIADACGTHYTITVSE